MNTDYPSLSLSL